MIKRHLKKYLPRKLVRVLSGTRLLPAHFARSFSSAPLREWVEIIKGNERAPAGSLDFFQAFFAAVNRTTTDPVIVDVGANNGWFPRLLSRFVTRKDIPIHSYEPLRSMRPSLDILQMDLPNVQCYSVAVGESSRKTAIIELASSGLSSLRELKPEYHGYAERYATQIVNRYEVDVVPLDEEFERYVRSGQDVVLKVDTQGFEMQVLQGCKRWLRSGRVKWILIELMTEEKYQGASGYREIFDYLHDLDFHLFDIFPCVRETNGRLSEFDAVFVHGSISL